MKIISLHLHPIHASMGLPPTRARQQSNQSFIDTSELTSLSRSHGDCHDAAGGALQLGSANRAKERHCERLGGALTAMLDPTQDQARCLCRAAPRGLEGL
jgi:hypothetical protein